MDGDAFAMVSGTKINEIIRTVDVVAATFAYVNLDHRSVSFNCVSKIFKDINMATWTLEIASNIGDTKKEKENPQDYCDVENNG
jgi:hypothetical protein